MAAGRLQAALFDLDGVITDTASVHMRAWKHLFDDFLSEHSQAHGEPFRAFDDSDYLKYVDGKPRLDGIRCFLQSRGITLSENETGKMSTANSVHALGERKNRLFLDLLDRDGVPVFASSIHLLQQLRQHGITTAVVSSSRNCAHILELAGLSDLFDARADGVTLASEALAGKPEPDLFLVAAADLNALPANTMVVEDAAAGVQAGQRGGFGLVIGVARRHNKQTLRDSGADIVVVDLAELTLERIDDWFNQRYSGFALGT